MICCLEVCLSSLQQSQKMPARGQNVGYCLLCSTSVEYSVMELHSFYLKPLHPLVWTRVSGTFASVLCLPLSPASFQPLLGLLLNWAASSFGHTVKVVPWCKGSIYMFHTALAPAIGNLQCSLRGPGAPLESIQNRRTWSSVVSPDTSAYGGPICNLRTNGHVAMFEYHSWMLYHY